MKSFSLTLAYRGGFYVTTVYSDSYCSTFVLIISAFLANYAPAIFSFLLFSSLYRMLVPSTCCTYITTVATLGREMSGKN